MLPQQIIDKCWEESAEVPADVKRYPNLSKAVAITYTYKKPKYDPYEIFQPSKTFLNEVIKQLRQQAYELIAKNNSDLSGFAVLCNTGRLDKLNRLIRDYTFRLRGDKESSGTGNSIGPEHIRRAKEQPIQDFYTGKLRRQGKNLVGLCCFHNDTHASLTIYDQGRKFKCFSCSENGDTIDFIQKQQGLSFPMAVKFILHI